MLADDFEEIVPSTMRRFNRFARSLTAHGADACDLPSKLSISGDQSHHCGIVARSSRGCLQSCTGSSANPQTGGRFPHFELSEAIEICPHLTEMVNNA